MVEKLVPDPFLKNQKCSYLWINSLEFNTVCFICVSKSKTTKNIETKVLPKDKKRFELVTLARLWIIFEE